MHEFSSFGIFLLSSTSHACMRDRERDRQIFPIHAENYNITFCLWKKKEREKEREREEKTIMKGNFITSFIE
jgi:hypothetical protein